MLVVEAELRSRRSGKVLALGTELITDDGREQGVQAYDLDYHGVPALAIFRTYDPDQPHL